MIPKTTRDALEKAMADFDQSSRDTDDWLGWEDQGNRDYAVEHGGRL